MKYVICSISLFMCITAFAASDAQIVGAVFGDQKFLSSMGEVKIDSLQITEESEDHYRLLVNENAPLVDGCSYSASIVAKKERYAIGPATTGVRTVLKVKTNKPVCGGRR